jgi:hypothetical protein
MDESVLLFSQYRLSDVILGHERTMLKSIDDEYPPEYLLKANQTELLVHLEQRFVINPLIMNKEKITTDGGETDVDLSNDPSYQFLYAHRDDRNPIVKGRYIKFYIPYDGDEILFKCQPSQYSSCPPRAILHGTELVIIYKGRDLNKDKIAQEFNQLLGQIEGYAAVVNRDIAVFNNTYVDKLKQIIESRKTQYLDTKGLAASFGFPLHESNLPKTYIVPIEKKKILFEKPKVRNGTYLPEPEIEASIYESILKVIMDMVHVMERSPSTFSNLKEEDLRQHFLVQLNGHFEGRATGETFNYEGKTDILIRHEGKNLFIAECLIWQGKKYLLEKIDQLLGYTTWRDTKTAVLIFNKNKNFSDVVNQITDVVKEHPNFLKQIDYKNESGFRFSIKQKHDVSREIVLTVLCFNIPEI